MSCNEGFIQLDIDDAGLEASYNKHRQAYINTFDRLGLKYNIVSAMSARWVDQIRGVPSPMSNW